MNEHIVVVKLITREEIVGVLVDDTDGVLKIEQPCIIRFDFDSDRVMLYPYCLWSEDSTFTFKPDKVIYNVSCGPEIADKYLDMMDALKKKKDIANTKELNQVLDKIESYLTKNKLEELQMDDVVYIEGNNTKH